MVQKCSLINERRRTLDIMIQNEIFPDVFRLQHNLSVVQLPPHIPEVILVWIFYGNFDTENVFPDKDVPLGSSMMMLMKKKNIKSVCSLESNRNRWKRLSGETLDGHVIKNVESKKQNN